MRKPLYSILSAAGPRLGSIVTIVLAAWPAGDPESFKRWWGWAVTPEHVRYIGLAIVSLCLAYWALLWWLKPVAAESPTIPELSNHGHISAQVGVNQGNISFGAPSRYSSEQSIVSLHAAPGNQWIKLSSFGTLRACSPYGPYGIAMALNQTVIEDDPDYWVNTEYVSHFSVTYGYSPTYYFDCAGTNQHEVESGGAKFVVSLLRVTKYEAPDVVNAFRYYFLVAEK